MTTHCFCIIFVAFVLYLNAVPCVLSSIELVNSPFASNHDQFVPELKQDIKSATYLYLPSYLPSGYIGEEVIFELKKGLRVTGTIERLNKYRAHSFTWSGSVTNEEGGMGTFHLSYSEGAIIAKIDGTYGYQYELHPLSLADNLYVMEEVALAKYDKMESLNDAISVPNPSGDYEIA